MAVLDHLEAVAPERLADEMVALRDEFGLKVLGGCCGTDDRHIAALAERLMVRGCWPAVPADTIPTGGYWLRRLARPSGDHEA